MKENIWKKFEKTVTNIERQLAGTGAVVKHSDYVTDKVTGEIRQIDATIRYMVGSVQILIAIECRKHKRKSDVTWIEQLGTKKKKIGANSLIAVSEKGFSEQAIKTAESEGIELRTLKELHETDVREWLKSGPALASVCGWHIGKFAIHFDTDEKDIVLDPSISERIKEDDLDALIGENKETGEKIILRKIGQEFLEQEGLVNNYGETFHAQMEPESPIYVETNKGDVKIKSIEFDIEVFLKPMGLTSSKVYDYASLEKSFAKVTELEFSHGELSVKFEFINKIK